MTPLAIAALLFVGSHLLLPRPLLRGPLVRLMGERIFSGFFSVIALGTLVWMVRAYNDAKFASAGQPLWDGTPFVWLPLILMPFVLLLLVTGLTAGNPSSLGQAGVLKRNEAARGVLRITRHPFNMGVALLGLAHIPSNGDPAALWFFGAFAALGLIGALTQDHKNKAKRGEDWKRFSDVTSVVPFAAILAGRNRLVPGEFGWWRPLLALALYGGLIAAHPWLFGVGPF